MGRAKPPATASRQFIRDRGLARVSGPVVQARGLAPSDAGEDHGEPAGGAISRKPPIRMPAAQTIGPQQGKGAGEQTQTRRGQNGNLHGQ